MVGHLVSKKKNIEKGMTNQSWMIYIDPIRGMFLPLSSVHSRTHLMLLLVLA